MRQALLLLTMLALVQLLHAQHGKVYDNLSMESEILKMDRKFAVYLPPDYESSQRSYPVLYLLHGAGDDQTGWIQFGEVLHITDKDIHGPIGGSRCLWFFLLYPRHFISLNTLK